MYRDQIATFAMSSARRLGNSLGCELAVDVSEHSIETRMETPDTSRRAWDSNLYQSGNLFVSGYANPVKPRIEQRKEREVLDSAEFVDGEPDDPDGDDRDDQADGDDEDDAHVGLIPSTRYRAYQDQHLISELVNPREQWRMIVFGIIGVGVLQFLGIIVTLYATGGF